MRRLGILVGTLMMVAAVIGGLVLLRPDATTPAVPPPVPPAIEAGDEYVAIGDSYTAAPGTGPPSADGCWRSSVNYPHQVAKTLRLKLKDVSCSGATTYHVTSGQVFGAVNQPPQADALSPSTDLVTISLGANDFQIVGFVFFDCIAVRGQDPTGAPCQETNEQRGGIEKKIAQVQEHLVSVITHVADRAPEARIIVVGYPEFFPRTGPCAQLPLALGDYALAGRVNRLLVGVQERAAAQSKVEYLDIYTPSRGHHMCAKDPWIAGARPTRPDGTPFHPYPEEQRLVADLLVDRLS